MNESGRYGWYVVGLTLVNQALTVGILIYSFALFVVPWLDDFPVERSDIMVAIFLMQIVTGIASPTCGRLLDRYPIRWLAVIGIVAMAVGFILLANTNALWQVILIYSTLLPLGTVLAGTLAAQTLVTRWFTSRRGVAIGVSAMGTSLGGLGFPILIEWLIRQYDWQPTFLILATIAFAVVPLTLIVLKREPPGPKGGSLGEERITTRGIFGRPTFWIPVLGFVPVNISFSGVQFHLGAYVNDLGFSQTLAASLIATTSAGMIVGKLMFGSLGDRIDHRKLYWVVTIALCSALVLYSGDPSRPHLFAAAGLQGIASGGVLPLMALMFGSRFETRDFGRVMGFVNMFTMAGGVGSLVSGWLFAWTGTYDAAFYLYLAFVLPAAVLMVWLPPARAR